VNDQSAIEAAISNFVAAFNAGDIDALLQCYGDDLIKLRQGAAPETKSDVARRVSELFIHYRTRVEVVNDELLVSEGLAVGRGWFKVTLTSKTGGETQTFERRYLEVWRKEGNDWLVVRTMDNTE
jgi:ketosteroid isomerase-like protein